MTTLFGYPLPVVEVFVAFSIGFAFLFRFLYLSAQPALNDMVGALKSAAREFRREYQHRRAWRTYRNSILGEDPFSD